MESRIEVLEAKLARKDSVIGYVTPSDKSAGREDAIWHERDRKLETAQDLRRQRRRKAREAA